MCCLSDKTRFNYPLKCILRLRQVHFWPALEVQEKGTPFGKCWQTIARMVQEAMEGSAFPDRIKMPNVNWLSKQFVCLKSLTENVGYQLLWGKNYNQLFIRRFKQHTRLSKLFVMVVKNSKHARVLGNKMGWEPRPHTHEIKLIEHSSSY